MAKEKIMKTPLIIGICLLLLGQASAETNPNHLLQYAGVYLHGEAGEIVVSFRTHGDRSILILTDLRTDIVRGLFPQSEDRFILGKELLQPDPAEYEVNFIRNAQGKIHSLQITELDTNYMVSAIRSPQRILPVEFSNGSVALKGDLYLPGEKSEFPAVVLAHGSEDSDRYSFDALPYVLANHGFAVLSYDKRGTGESGGSWQDSGLEPVAEDLLSGIEWLRRRQDINGQRIGVIGFSEGGWIAPLAAARSSSISFIVSISGGAYTKAHSFLYKYRQQFLEQGMAGAELEKAMREKDAIVRASAERVRTNDHPNGFDLRISYDPAEHWKAFQKPVLYLGGEFDVLEPVAESAARLHDIFSESRNPDFTIKIFPKTNHAMFLAATNRPSDFLAMKGVKQFVAGYWDTLLRWLQTRIL